MTALRVAGVVTDSVVDGPGVRYTVFLQGCPHRCPECHNPETHDFLGGKLYDTETLFEDIAKRKFIRAVTLSGGEPLSQAVSLPPFFKRLKEAGYHLMLYTGYTFEEILKDEAMLKALSFVDILVDGRYEKNLRTLAVPFIGSANQRIIDVQTSLKLGAVRLADL